MKLLLVALFVVAVYSQATPLKCNQFVRASDNFAASMYSIGLGVGKKTTNNTQCSKDTEWCFYAKLGNALVAGGCDGGENGLAFLKNSTVSLCKATKLSENADAEEPICLLSKVNGADVTICCSKTNVFYVNDERKETVEDGENVVLERFKRYKRHSADFDMEDALL